MKGVIVAPISVRHCGSSSRNAQRLTTPAATDGAASMFPPSGGLGRRRGPSGPLAPLLSGELRRRRRRGFVLRLAEIFEAVFVDRFHERFVRRDDALLQECPDGVVHELHPLPFAGHDHVLKFLGGAFADDGGDGGVRDQDFVHGDAPEPSAFFKSNCARTPRSEFASMARACA